MEFSISGRPKTVQPASGVKVEPAPHGANPILNAATLIVNTPMDLLKGSCRKSFEKIRKGNLIQSSFDGINNFMPAKNGFVASAVLAYNQHHHLILRPEDIWFSILGQLNVYINAHAEELRDKFVAHKDQMPLVIDNRDSSIGGKGATAVGVDWAKFAYQIGKRIEENIIDPSLRQWCMPSFTTTKKSDQVTASILMMSTMQKYFSYAMELECGLPSVTLLGKRSDWVDILGRLERLKTFGDEPTIWYSLLKPVLTSFVKSFDDPDCEEVRDFWQKIAHSSSGGSGTSYLSGAFLTLENALFVLIGTGWITAFCFWDEDGICHYNTLSNLTNEAEMSSLVLVLDGARYHFIEDYAPGYASVPVSIQCETSPIEKCEMVAGSVGMKLSSSNNTSPSSTFDTIQPGSGWWMYEIMSEEETMVQKKAEYEEWRVGRAWLPEWKGKESLGWLQ